MSGLAPTLQVGRARRHRAAVRVALSRTRAIPLGVAAFVGSRLLVLAAGFAGSSAFHLDAAHAMFVRWQPLGSLGGVLTASATRFDAGYYLDIAHTGYGSGLTPRLAFLPLYPEAIRALSVLTRSPVAAGMLISIVSFALALVMLHRLTERELGARAADATVVLLCFAPLSFFFSAVYTESLFLALSVGVFSAARTGRWRLACVLAALATLTRPTGFVLAGALLVMWRRSGAPRRELWWVALAPAALVAWYGTLALLGHGLTGGLRVEHTLWFRSTVFPLYGLIEALLAAVQGLFYIAGGGTVWHPAIQGPFLPLVQDVLLGGILMACLVGLEACRRRMRPEYATYAGLVVLLCLTTPEKFEPLWSFDRFALTIFPLWMAAGAFVARRRLLVPAALLGGVALTGYTMLVAGGVFIA